MSIIRKKYQKSTTIRVIKEAAKSLVGILKTKGKIATPVLVSKRMKVCNSCEHFNGSTCSICKCRANWKTMLEGSSCPLKKW